MGVERVTLTTDGPAMQPTDGLLLLRHAQGFVVARRVFVRAPAEEPYRVRLHALERSLPPRVALVGDGRRAAPRGQHESLNWSAGAGLHAY